LPAFGPPPTPTDLKPKVVRSRPVYPYPTLLLTLGTAIRKKICLSGEASLAWREGNAPKFMIFRKGIDTDRPEQ
jgi:hypothetical protein